jgi:hypothetical protein
VTESVEELKLLVNVETCDGRAGGEEDQEGAGGFYGYGRTLGVRWWGVVFAAGGDMRSNAFKTSENNKAR